MFDFTGLADMKGWMRNPTVEAAGAAVESTGSVVISSRVRLARNLSTYSYPGRSPADQEKECRERIVSAFRRLPNAEDFTIIYMEDISCAGKKDSLREKPRFPGLFNRKATGHGSER